jgi:hypothetical protein
MRGPVNHRRHFLDKNLLYLFSVDANLENGREDIGCVPAGIRINASSDPRGSRVYNVTGETQVIGEKIISGTIVWGCDFALARRDDIEVLNVRLVIQADDGAAIEGDTTGVLSPGPRTYHQVLTEKPKFGSEENPKEVAFVMAPRFFSGHQNYKWLSYRQCMAIGRVKFIQSTARQTTIDVWMMD